MIKNYIWDMDGTLIDSYDSIVDNIENTIEHFGIYYSRSFVRNMIQRESTNYFFEHVSKKHNIDFFELSNYHNSIKIDISSIKLMPNVEFTLKKLYDLGANNFIYTHRGSSTYDILEENRIDYYFVEVVTSNNGFKRKPSSEAIDYLVGKYQMNKKETCYIGDRIVDQECAKNSGINRVYYQSYKGISLEAKDYDYRIESLLELINI